MGGAGRRWGIEQKGRTVSRPARFTVITDGEILTNNSEDGPAPHRLDTGFTGMLARRPTRSRRR